MSIVARSANIGKFTGDIAEIVRDNPQVKLWALQEAESRPGRRAQLESLDGYTPHMARGWAKAGDAPLVIHDSIPQRPLPPIRLRRTWKRPRGPGRHPARTINRAEVQISGRWVEVQSDHNPERRGWIRLARREFIGAVIRSAKAADHFVGVGDWNGKANERAPGFPGQLVVRAGLKPAGTGLIDEFYGSGGIQFSATRVLGRLGDHRQVQTVISLTSAPPPPPPPPDPPEDPMPLTPEDWTRLTALIQERTLDVGKPSPWSDDKVAEVLLNTVGRLEAAAGRIETAVAALRAVHEEPPA